MGADEIFDFIVVGGGCIGTSTVHALITERPGAKIAWFTGKHKRTASNDFIKIIRDVYPDDVVSEFANRALQKWMSTSPYREYFHKTAWIRAICSDDENRMTRRSSDDVLTASEMMEAVGSDAAPLLDESEELFLNPNVGYADSARAVESIADDAVKLGVRRHKINVTRLIVEDGKCLGVQVEGSIVKGANQIIVSAGAWTPSLLAQSGIAFPPDFFTATAIAVATVALSDQEFTNLKSMPILATEKAIGEIMLSHRERVLKINYATSFRISDPDQLSDAVDVTGNRELLEKMLPQFKGRDLESFICPDLLTPYQYPIIDRMPDVRHLIIATGGSYHSYKLLPVIGEIVALRIRNHQGRDSIESALLNRCRWERMQGTKSIHARLVPQS
ncbi:FAD dependent oxidoreductase [Hypoxylon argillaceum]|nr:FAD dependent oxidoreductase [Hypoxylon argillaceum]